MKYWELSKAYGASGFVQCRYMSGDFPNLELASIEFHAPIYYVNITRHVAGYVDCQLREPNEFRNIDEAKAWAVAMVGLS